MEQELELVQVNVFGGDSVPSQVGTHENTEAILAYDSLIKHFSCLGFGFLGGGGVRLGCLNLEVLNLLLLSCNSFQIHELSLQQVQNGLRWLWLPHLV